MSLNNYRIISLTLCSFLLAACNSANLNLPQQNTTLLQQNTATQERTLPPSIYQPKKTSSSDQAIRDALQQAQKNYDDGNFIQAISILEKNVLGKDSSVQFDAFLLAANINAQLDNALDAFDLLNNAEQLAIARHPDKQNALQETRASIFEHFSNWPEAVKLRMALSYSLPLNEGASNQAKLWLAVQNLTQNEIDSLYQEQQPILNGWLTISNILRDQSLSIEQQLANYQTWQQENTNHPAAISPPQDFQIMASVEEMAPEKVVLMLPMTGKLKRASQAIVDGFFATYYNQREKRPQVNIVDVDQFNDINSALQAANEMMPDIIIGPLQKNNVAKISRLVLPHPVIALNQLDFNEAAQNLFHFSLNAEDEIHELISFAKQEGATKAAVLSTQDTWALKQNDEFTQAAQQEHVTITSTQSYANTPQGRQNAVQKLLLINESTSRRKSIEKWTGSKVESIARPRQDLDYVFYVGKLNDAKQIRPLLDFYFADSVPMLATSSLNDSAPDKNGKAEDIERILFTELPALSSDNKTASALPANPGSNILRRLQAMGADSYLLANKYQLFALLKSTKISANTGIITMDDKGVFHKRPEIMTYRRGNLVYARSKQFFQSKENNSEE